MWEVFVFVNPIGQRCLKTEQLIIDFAKKHHINAHFKFVALNNFLSMDHYLKNNNYNLHDINLRNKLTNDVYQATLYYKAATFQGNKKGRQFLINLQHAINFQSQKFTIQLMQTIAQSVNLDWRTMVKDAKNELTLSQCIEDQKIASELGINETPTTVIYDYSQNQEAQAFCLKNCSPIELTTVLKSLISDTNLNDQQIAANPVLHLVK